MKQTPNYAKRMEYVKPSFIREILSVAQSKDIISFAGGLPNENAFPVEGLQRAAAQVLSLENYSKALQYSTTEGIDPLRTWVADRYNKRFGMNISKENILLTTGSQQALDLIGKAFLDPGDQVLMENPGYLGAKQVWSMFQAQSKSIEVDDNGPNFSDLNSALNSNRYKLYYSIPSFQNPTGFSYGSSTRKRISELIDMSDTVLIEDDPYGELFFDGYDRPPIMGEAPGKNFLLGSFSKTLAPGLRVGWVVASKTNIMQLARLKQSADLHSSSLSQCIIHSFLFNNNYEEYLIQLRRSYRSQRDLMVETILTELAEKVSFSIPQGGMFLWLTLTNGMDATELLMRCKERGVIFVPGIVFGEGNENTLRLNYSNASIDEIKSGIRIIGEELSIDSNSSLF